MKTWVITLLCIATPYLGIAQISGLPLLEFVQRLKFEREACDSVVTAYELKVAMLHRHVKQEQAAVDECMVEWDKTIDEVEQLKRREKWYVRGLVVLGGVVVGAAIK